MSIGSIEERYGLGAALDVVISGDLARVDEVSFQEAFVAGEQNVAVFVVPVDVVQGLSACFSLGGACRLVSDGEQDGFS